MAASTRIADIDIELPEPLPYLEVLAHALVNQFPAHAGIGEVVNAIAEAIGYRPERLSGLTGQTHAGTGVDFERLPQVIGWHHHERIEQLLHRDWLDAESNEFDPHRALMDQLASVAAARRPTVIGTGVGAMADDLAARDGVESVDSNDLSFVCLWVAAAMHAGRSEALPEELRRPRIDVQAPAGMFLQSSDLGSTYRPSRARVPVSMRVADAYAMRIDESTDLVIAPYLIDAVDDFATMLTRLSERMRDGQRLLLLTQCCPRRDPRKVEAALGRLQFRIDGLRFERLPYSLSRHDFFYTRSIGNTLVIEAQKIAEVDGESIGFEAHTDVERLVAESQRELVPGQRHRWLGLSKRERGEVKRALHAANYGDFCARLREGVGSERGEMIVQFVCGRGLVGLSPLQSVRRFG